VSATSHLWRRLAADGAAIVRRQHRIGHHQRDLRRACSKFLGNGLCE
jgi:hypothetical protein